MQVSTAGLTCGLAARMRVYPAAASASCPDVAWCTACARMKAVSMLCLTAGMDRRCRSRLTDLICCSTAARAATAAHPSWTLDFLFVMVKHIAL